MVSLKTKTRATITTNSMGHNAKKILAAVAAAGLAITLSGCAEKETSPESPITSTESTTSSTESKPAESTTQSSTASASESKPAESTSSTAEPTASSTESVQQSTASVPESKPAESKPTESDLASSISDPTESNPTESKPEQSTPSSSTPTTPPTTPSVNPGHGSYENINRMTGKPLSIEIPEGATGEFFDQYGNPMPDNFNPDDGGYYDKYGAYVMTPAEYEQMMRDIEEENQQIKDGTFSGTAGATQEEADAFLARFGL